MFIEHGCKPREITRKVIADPFRTTLETEQVENPASTGKYGT